MTEDLARFALAVEESIRSSEVDAVAKLMRSGESVHVGQIVEYHFGDRPSHRKEATKPYRVAVEQWHLDAAALLVERTSREFIFR